MKKPGKALFEPLPSDPFWVREVKAIKEVEDYDLEFGKRYLLELLAMPGGEAKFMDFMTRAHKILKTPPFELEELELTPEEDGLMDKMQIAITMDKFLRTEGWLLYGRSAFALSIITTLHVIYTVYEWAHGKDMSNIELALTATEGAVVIPSDILLYYLLKYTSEHEFDDTKYEELQRAIIELTDKFPHVFDRDSHAAKLSYRREWEHDGSDMFL